MRAFAIAILLLTSSSPPLAFCQQRVEEFEAMLTTPLSLLYLDQQAVRTELKLSHDQAERLERLQTEWAKRATKSNLEIGFVAVLREQLTIGVAKEIAGILSKEQQTRLQQVIRRHREKESGLAAVLDSLVHELKLTPAQQEQFERLRARRAEIVLESLTSGERFPLIGRKVHDANRDFAEQVEKLLTEAQLAKRNELLGEPWSGDIQLREPLYVRLVVGRSAYFDKLFGVYALEPEILNNESVQIELKMPDDQVRKAKELYVEWAEKLEKSLETTKDPQDAVAALSEWVDVELNKILKAAQSTRLREIAMQYRAKAAGTSAAFGYPGVAKYLRLSDRDQQQIKEGVYSFPLTASPIFGKKFEGELIFRKGWLMVDHSASTRLQKPTVAGPLEDRKKTIFAHYMIDKSRQLGLTDEQAARLKEIAEDAPKIRQLLHKELSGLPSAPILGSGGSIRPEARAVEQYRKAIFEQCFETLDKQQQSLHGAALRKVYREY